MKSPLALIIAGVGLLALCLFLHKRDNPAAVAAHAAEDKMAEYKPIIPAAQVTRTSDRLVLDGRLEEAAWSAAAAHDLELLDSGAGLAELARLSLSADAYEKGRARFLCDGEYLYVGIEFEDRDLVAQERKDQTKLFATGDVGEVFIKAESSPGYWELYVSPLGNQTSYFFPSAGYFGLPDYFLSTALPEMKAAAAVKGTVNDYTSPDLGWTAELAIPLRDLKEKTGADFTSGSGWRILVSRYNYGYNLRGKQLSSFPKLPQVNYHLLEYYAPIKFAPQVRNDSGQGK